MQQDEIIEMARQAGFRVGPSRDGPDTVRGVGLNLEWFAKLVAAKEREACAKTLLDLPRTQWSNQTVSELAKVIRARSSATSRGEQHE